MKYHSYVHYLVLTLFLVTGCHNKPINPIEDKKEELIPINISMSGFTKATDSSFEIDDEVGIFIVNQDETPLKESGNHADNVAYTFNGSEWKSDKQLYWKNSSTKADFYCYYPRLTKITDITRVPIKVKTDQSRLSGLKESVIIWGSNKEISPTADPISILVSHRTSKIIIKLIPGNGYTKESLANEDIKLYINSLKVNGYLDLSSGNVIASGNPEDILPYAESDNYQAYVIPQTINNETLVSLKVGNYSFSLKQSIEFKSNTQHTVSLTVNKISEGINIGIIGWENDENDYGGTVN